MSPGSLEKQHEPLNCFKGAKKTGRETPCLSAVCTKTRLSASIGVNPSGLRKQVTEKPCLHSQNGEIHRSNFNFSAWATSIIRALSGQFVAELHKQDADANILGWRCQKQTGSGNFLSFYPKRRPCHGHFEPSQGGPLQRGGVATWFAPGSGRTARDDRCFPQGNTRSTLFN